MLLDPCLRFSDTPTSTSILSLVPLLSIVYLSRKNDHDVFEYDIKTFTPFIHFLFINQFAHSSLINFADPCFLF